MLFEASTCGLKPAGSGTTKAPASGTTKASKVVREQAANWGPNQVDQKKLKIYKKIPKMYIRIFTRYTNIYQDIWKKPGGGGAAPPGPALRRHGPDRDRHIGAGPGRGGPAAAWYFVSAIYLYTLDTFGYIGIYILAYV